MVKLFGILEPRIGKRGSFLIVYFCAAPWHKLALSLSPLKQASHVRNHPLRRLICRSYRSSGEGRHCILWLYQQRHRHRAITAGYAVYTASTSTLYVSSRLCLGPALCWTWYVFKTPTSSHRQCPDNHSSWCRKCPAGREAILSQASWPLVRPRHRHQRRSGVLGTWGKQNPWKAHNRLTFFFFTQTFVTFKLW